MLIAWNVMLLLTAIIIYIGCRRSYSIYFFERDERKVIFLEDEGAIAVPVVLSVLLFILYHSLKSLDDYEMEEEVEDEKVPELLQKSSISYQLAKKIPPKMTDGNSKSAVAEKDIKEKENVDGIILTDGIRGECSSSEGVLLRKKFAIQSDDERAIERERSEIYKKMSKVYRLPSVNEIVNVMRSSLANISKHSVLIILARLITIHALVWLGAIAVQITLVEIFDSNFYYIFYYHHPTVKQLAIIIAVLLGIFHEVKWTWVVNDIFGIAISYVTIARTETASYFAGFLFLVGMISFDIFWFYCIDLLSVVAKHSRSPVMLIIPLGKKRSAKISIVDIIVPGIFLNIILKFAEMYDIVIFTETFYACIFGLFITGLFILLRRKTTPAIVIPGIFAILASLLSTDNPSGLWRFKIKH
ncbi:unnamed protein product [Litomosoides sigmodontis]|uniref:Uncharacterized protein n=1 Tax=Litomosoides sigmodontis TaxID=42156 RepID=A0A3P7JM56_LITSI|nr:unnamed protein product [Litomosoides sigmodontis]